MSIVDDILVAKQRKLPCHLLPLIRCVYSTHFLNPYSKATISNVNYSSLYIFWLNKQFMREKNNFFPLFNFSGCLENFFCPSNFVLMRLSFIRSLDITYSNLRIFLCYEFTNSLTLKLNCRKSGIFFGALQILESTKMSPNFLRLV